MDANELATIAFDAMPLDVLAEADKGQVWGVLQMALRTLEAQHESLLAEADNEAAEARKLLAAQISTPLHSHGEFEELTNELRDAQVAMQLLQTELKAERHERGRVARERDSAIAEANRLTQENARLHRSMEEWMSAAQKPRMPLHSHSEFEELQKKLDSANTDKGYLADAILKTLPPETCMKVFDAYHKFRGTYADALPPGAVKVAAPIQDETGVTVLTGEVTYPGAK